MLRLAVATDAETLARIREPLAERGIHAEHVPVSERTLPLDGSLDERERSLRNGDMFGVDTPVGQRLADSGERLGVGRDGETEHSAHRPGGDCPGVL